MLKVYNCTKEIVNDRQKTIAKLYKAIAVSFLILLPLEVVVAVIHEGGHAIAGLMVGVPLREIRFSIHGVVPMTSIPLRFASSNLTFFHYAGGFTSGLILIIVYFLYWNRNYQNKPTTMNWSVGLAIAAALGGEIFIGFFEGRFNAIYMQDVYYGTGITPVLIALAIIGAGLIHIIRFPFSKIV